MSALRHLLPVAVLPAEGLLLAVSVCKHTRMSCEHEQLSALSNLWQKLKGGFGSEAVLQ